MEMSGTVLINLREKLEADLFYWKQSKIWFHVNRSACKVIFF